MSPLLTLYKEYQEREQYDRERHAPPGNVVAPQVQALVTLHREYRQRAEYERSRNG